MLHHVNRKIALLLASLLLVSGCSSTGPASSKKAGYSSPEYQQARALMEAGQFRDAIPVLQAVNQARPKLAEPYVNLAIAYRHTEQPEKALAALEKAIELEPNSAPAHHQMGIVYRELGLFDESLAAYRKALKLKPDYALAHLNLGILYDLYLQRPDQALGQYRQYQKASAGEDKQVDGWILDLQRRTGSKRAGVSK